MKLSPELRIEIGEEVEKRLQHLPAETLKLIQNEIDARIATTEKHYTRLFAVTVALMGVVLVGFFGLTWHSVSGKVASLLADTEIRKKIEQISSMHADLVKQKQQCDELASQLLQRNEDLKASLAALKDAERIVRYNENGDLVLATRDGRIRIMQKDGPNSGTILWSGQNFQITHFGGLVFEDLKHNQITHMAGAGME
jgi:hypothetical protein